jgi:uncharacterized protein
MNPHGLSDTDLKTIWHILQPFTHQITQAGIFGSRAKGTYRADSDLDLVLYGTLDDITVARLITLFQESLLPFTVDVVAYHLLEHDALKAHIDRVMVPLPHPKSI